MTDPAYIPDGLLSESELWRRGSIVFNTTAANSTAFMPPLVDKAISFATVIVLFITMVSLGCTMEVSKIKAHITRPKGVAIAVLAQYGVMPLTAFCLAKVLQLGPVEAVTVLICGCCPGGSVSNILALALQGDMNLSIVMTTCSTVLALGLMPLLLYLYCQGFSNMENAVPYAGITVGLVMTLIPCGVGILINYYRPQYSRNITKVGMVILLIAMVGIGIATSVAIGSSVLTVLAPPLMAAAALMPLIGFSFGYVLSSLCRLNGSERRTVAMETGCQNIQLCLTVLKLAFPAEVIGPLYLFPTVYIVFQLMEASVLIVLFRCHQRFKKKGTDKQQPEMMALQEVKQPEMMALQEVKSPPAEAV